MGAEEYCNWSDRREAGRGAWVGLFAISAGSAAGFRSILVVALSFGSRFWCFVGSLP